ncbi:hypothetical protein niasHT_009645 [Heterodera trifolii]|uniref:glutaminase n=1 Tax=Heterodera trifolii TaxID=157864 RepID=A0ABD2M0L9_9BILA
MVALNGCTSSRSRSSTPQMMTTPAPAHVSSPMNGRSAPQLRRRLSTNTLEQFAPLKDDDRRLSLQSVILKTKDGLDNPFACDEQSPEELIYNLFKIPHKSDASIGKLIMVLKNYGLQENDPRLAPMMRKIREIENEKEERMNEARDPKHWKMSHNDFKRVIGESLSLIVQTLQNDLIVPAWAHFGSIIKEIYTECIPITDGNVANYIPQLARMSPNYWGVSICTVDGQRISFGDSKVPFCVQSVSKALNYSIAASEMGAEYVHQYVGQEPSGRLFNEICLDPNNKPHNPMVNSGAIIVSSLIRAQLNMADRFEYMINEYKKMAGGEYVGFNNAVFLSEAATADRNFALAYFMKENGCFPEESKHTSLKETLDFYFQLCSLEVNCEGAAVIASTLANGGVCPLTGERCIGSRPCRDVLSLMNSCGMYDYSGQFAFHVGLPAKSGVSGVTIVVVPNLMGIALWSPPLDRMGNSCRGVHFCKKLIDRFNFHNYDSLAHNESQKFDPRRRVGEREKTAVVSLLFASKAGDLNTIRRMYLQGCDLEMADYDKRTALHLAASEGHFDVALFLLETGKVQPDPRDRWNRTPLDDARSEHHTSVALMLERRMQDITQTSNLPANKPLQSRTVSLHGLQAVSKSRPPVVFGLGSPPATSSSRQMSVSSPMVPTMPTHHVQSAGQIHQSNSSNSLHSSASSECLLLREKLGGVPPPVRRSPLCHCNFSANAKQQHLQRADSATVFSCLTTAVKQSTCSVQQNDRGCGGGSLRKLSCSTPIVVGHHYGQGQQHQHNYGIQNGNSNNNNNRTVQYNNDNIDKHHHNNNNSCNNNQLTGHDQSHAETQGAQNSVGHDESGIFEYYHDVQTQKLTAEEDADSLEDIRDRGISLRYSEISDSESHGASSAVEPFWASNKSNKYSQQKNQMHEHGQFVKLQHQHKVEISSESDEEEEEDILTESNDVQKISQMCCPSSVQAQNNPT